MTDKRMRMTGNKGTLGSMISSIKKKVLTAVKEKDSDSEDETAIRSRKRGDISSLQKLSKRSHVSKKQGR